MHGVGSIVTPLAPDIPWPTQRDYRIDVVSRLLSPICPKGAARWLDPSPRFPELLMQASVDTKSYLGVAYLGGSFGVAKGFASETVPGKPAPKGTP